MNGVGNAVASANTDAQAAQAVNETLQSQRDSLSGVSLDEEAVNLQKYQQAYQAASKSIAAADQMFQTILGLFS